MLIFDASKMLQKESFSLLISKSYHDCPSAYFQWIVMTYYGNSKVSYSGATNKLERIIEQKWISLWLNVESWFDYRRTGYPALVVGVRLKCGCCKVQVYLIKSGLGKC